MRGKSWLKRAAGDYYGIISALELCILVFAAAAILREEPLNFAFGAQEIFAETSQGRLYGGVMDDSSGENVTQVRTPDMMLEKGIYDITVEYQGGGIWRKRACDRERKRSQEHVGGAGRTACVAEFQNLSDLGQ